MTSRLRVVAATALLLSTTTICLAGGKSDPSDQALTIDIPVKMDQANVVFCMNHYVIRGDMPVGLQYMNLLSKNLNENGTKAQIIGVFFSEGGHFTLKDDAYNAARGVTTGNPYKGFIAELMKQGVRIEECAETMRHHKWTNADLLPGVKVNSGAVQRLIQLGQQGFVQIHP